MRGLVLFPHVVCFLSYSACPFRVNDYDYGGTRFRESRAAAGKNRCLARKDRRGWAVIVEQFVR